MAVFTLEPGQSHFLANARALSASAEKFNISVWVDGYPAADGDYVRINIRFVGWTPKGQMGENRDAIDKVRQIKFWPKKEG